MRLDFAHKSEEPAREQLVGAFELSDEELAGVVGGDGCCFERRRRRGRSLRCKRWDRRGRCREFEWEWF
jgi:hypothetical protein